MTDDFLVEVSAQHLADLRKLADLRRGQFHPWHKRWLREAETAVGACYRAALAASNYGLADKLMTAAVNLRLLAAEFAPAVLDLGVDCWLPEAE